ncbi:O-antigen/teichoic acid export membrane protein [Methanococcus maripaludis]|uniref:O-antigen/teichoic acid export membrane protein n=1 Tax=Methanococcus maripaludis TaxID=39152 RepID=A0A7J9NWK5_METMI|nr:flippase [Methanococcus maripaludis]MBA2851393.1 O-antigen/teichoic acid export membrane protein [Methanococcus maripaludis]
MKDVQWSFIGLLTASLSHFLLRILLGRELGPSGLGIYTLVFTIYMFGMQFATFGIGVALTKYVSEFSDDINKVKEYVSAGFYGSIFTGFLTGILLFIISEYISTYLFKIPMTELLKITALCFPFISVQRMVLGTLNGFRKMKQNAFLEILLNVFTICLTILLVVFFNMGVVGAIYGFTIPTIIVGIFSIRYLNRYIIYPRRLMLGVIKKIRNFGFYVAIANSIGLINTHIDSIMVGYFTDEINVGYYAVATLFGYALLLVPSSIQRITYPLFSKYYAKKDYAAILNLFGSWVNKTLAITLITSFLLVICSKYVISFLFGSNYMISCSPLYILLFGYSIYSPYVSIGGFFSSIGKVNIIYKVMGLCVLFNIFFNVLLIPRFGISGAACATSLSLIISVIINMVIISKILKSLGVNS